MAKDKSASKGKRKDALARADASAAAKKPRTSTASSKGKERSASDDRVTLTAASNGTFDVGPVLVSTGDINLPEDANFKLHHVSAGPSSDDAGASGSGVSMQDSMLLVGETESIDLVGWNWDLNMDLGSDVNARREAKGYAGEYVVGVYDPATKSVTLRQAPLFTLRRSVKALNSLQLNAHGTFNDWEERVLARRSLGESFGNRKTKARARNEDRMKVDTSNMTDVMDTLQSNIDMTMQGLPTRESMEEEANLKRPIPPPNLQAVVPQEAYPVSVLIPDGVLRLLQIFELESAESAEQLGKFVPQASASVPWLRERLWTLVQSAQYRKGSKCMGPKKIEFDADDNAIDEVQATTASTGILKTAKETSRLKLKVAMYIALLFGFIKTSGGKGGGGDREDLLKKLRLNRMSSPEYILDDLFERFAEKQRGLKRPIVTEFTTTKLYAYIFALALHLDDFSIEPMDFAKGFGLAASRASELFKSLGCTTRNIPAQADGARAEKRVILKCPVELPKPRRGRAN